MLSNVSTELGNFDLILELPFEASKQYFPLAWFESINDRRNRSQIISSREMDELLVDKVLV